MIRRYLWCLLLAGGAVLAAGPARAAVIPLSAEISIGREAAQFIEGEFPLSNDPLLLARVQRIGRRLAGVCDRPDLPFDFRVVDTPDINAFCLPGGFVYVFRGLLQGVPDDDALAFIIGHEIAHAVERHALGQFEKSQLMRIVLAPLGPMIGAFGRDVANLILRKKFSRDDETEADVCGLRYTTRAGFGLDSGVKAMDTLLKLGGKTRRPEFLLDHPNTERRKRAMAALAAELKKDMPAVVAQAPAALPEPLWLAPPAPEATPYFPLATGNTWTYRLSGQAGGATKATVRVVETDPADPRGAFRVETAYDAGVTVGASVAATGDGVRTRPAAAKEWRIEWLLQSGDGFAVQGPEDVTVPAGTFSCRRVRRLAADGSPLAEGWFAEGVGLVKVVWPSHGITRELLSYRLAAPRAPVAHAAK